MTFIGVPGYWSSEPSPSSAPASDGRQAGLRGAPVEESPRINSSDDAGGVTVGQERARLPESRPAAPALERAFLRSRPTTSPSNFDPGDIPDFLDRRKNVATSSIRAASAIDAADFEAADHSEEVPFNKGA